MTSLRRSVLTGLAAALLLVGLTGLAVGGVAAVETLHEEYHHEVERLDEAATERLAGDAAAASVPVYEFEALSPNGKAAVRAALNADDGTHVAGPDGRVPEFAYDWDLETSQVVRDDGTAYSVTTRREDVLKERIGLLALPVGLVAALLGVALWRRRTGTD